MDRTSFRDWPLACIGSIGVPVPCPRNGTVLVKTDEGREENGEHNSCERSCVRYGRRDGYRRWPNRAQRADVLLLRLQVQREIRSQSGAVSGQVFGSAGKQPWMLRLNRISRLAQPACPHPRLAASCSLFSQCGLALPGASALSDRAASGNGWGGRSSFSVRWVLTCVYTIALFLFAPLGRSRDAAGSA